MKFTTKLWQRSQNSYATTVPQNILAIKDVPVEEGDVNVDWSINEETGTVEVEFTEADSGGDE